MWDDGMMPISIEKKNVPSKYTYREHPKKQKNRPTFQNRISQNNDGA
jgi:hypothetical protein